MQIAICSNLANGVGLQRDYETLRAELEILGHTVTGIQFNGNAEAPNVDLTIFLEVVAEQYLGKRNWVVPNPEWWFRGWDSLLDRFELVLAKTRHCEQLFSPKATTKFLGWKSRDLRNQEIVREPNFLHVAGKSQTKNTTAVIKAWTRFSAPNVLTIVSQHYRVSHPRIKVLQRVTDAELVQLMNSHQFHVMPSAYEGWGHSLHEGLGVGAVIITTNSEPMCDWGNVLIPATVGSVHHGAQLYRVEARHVARAAHRALVVDVRGESQKSRLAFLAEANAFDERLRELVACA